MNLLYENESYTIIGAAQEVHRNLGPGFLEGVYQEAMAIELQQNRIPFEQEKQLKILYKGQPLHKCYYAVLSVMIILLLNLKHCLN